MAEHRNRPGSLIWDVPEPVGNQPSLSRARIVRAAVAVADADGVQAVTMRRIATEIGSPTPMSLYRYVGSKDGLVDLVLDEVYGEIELPKRRPHDWRVALRALGRSSWAVMQRHPWFAALSHSRPPFGPNALRTTEFGLSALDGLELSPRRAMSYVSMVNGLCIGFALQAGEESKMRNRVGLESDDDLRTAARPYLDQIVAGGRHPALSAWILDGAAFDDETGFDFVLDCLLDGIAARIERAA